MTYLATLEPYKESNLPLWPLYFPVKVTDIPHHRSVSGYGRKIPTQYLILFRGHWQRVYVANYGNSGTAYIRNFGYTVEIRKETQ